MSAFTEPLAQARAIVTLALLTPLRQDEAAEVLAALDLIEQRATDMETALAEAIQVIEWCGLNDKTPTYNYNEARSDGTKPKVGHAFNTPREFARYWPDKLRAVLSAREEGAT